MKKVILSVVMAAILVVGMVGTALANPVEWYMDGSPGSGTEADPYDMEHFTSGKSQSMSVSLNTDGTAGDVIYWVSDTASQSPTGTSFEDMDWNVILRLNMQPDDGDISVQIGTWNGSSFTSFGMTDSTASWSSPQATYNFNFPTELICAQGDSIAIRVANTSPNSSDDFTITSRSTVQFSGVETPAWPVPEIATIIMIALGIMAISGYVWYRRRQPAQVVA